jgi:hypothetical protein
MESNVLDSESGAGIRATSTSRAVRWLSWAGAVSGYVRDTWLIIGVTLFLLFGVEALYRLQAYVRTGGGDPDPVAVEASADWMPDYLKEFTAATVDQRWHPYVYARTAAYSGRFINVDGAGVRRTVQRAVPPDAPEVYMFGGSTMFGTFQRDHRTLPSTLAARMEQCGTSARFLNFGQSGRVFTQEVLDLLVKLRDGSRPRVVIFYDGLNDVVAAIQNHTPGWPQNERNRARDWDVGQHVFFGRSDLRAAMYLGWAALTRFEVLQRIRPFRVTGSLPALDEKNANDATALVTSYVATMQLVQAVSGEYGFVPVYVWQPSIHATRKRLTAFETRAFEQLRSNDFGRHQVALHREVAEKIDPSARAVAGTRFLNFSAVFDDETRPVFADRLGHTYESANDTLADALLAPVVRALNETGIATTCS